MGLPLPVIGHSIKLKDAFDRRYEIKGIMFEEYQNKQLKYP